VCLLAIIINSCIICKYILPFFLNTLPPLSPFVLLIEVVDLNSLYETCVKTWLVFFVYFCLCFCFLVLFLFLCLLSVGMYLLFLFACFHDNIFILFFSFLLFSEYMHFFSFLGGFFIQIIFENVIYFLSIHANIKKISLSPISM
jgi:hypothetical protein